MGLRHSPLPNRLDCVMGLLPPQPIDLMATQPCAFAFCNPSTHTAQSRQSRCSRFFINEEVVLVNMGTKVLPAGLPVD